MDVLGLQIVAQFVLGLVTSCTNDYVSATRSRECTYECRQADEAIPHC